jgi:hypothetical protein
VTDPTPTLIKKAMRGNAIEVWRSAADIAEWCATNMEAELSRMLDGPETCRQLAEIFRSTADALETDYEERVPSAKDA